MEPENHEVVQMSYLGWMIQSLGPFYGLVIPLVGLAVFGGACYVVITARRPGTIAAYLPFLALPLLIGMFGSVHGMISSFAVIAQSASSPKPSELAEGVSTALFTVFIGLMLTFPSFLVVAFGLLFRAFAEEAKPPRK